MDSVSVTICICIWTAPVWLRLWQQKETTHLTFPDLPKLCDAFYIGGTKSGAMFGEALVLIKEEFKDHFRFNMKQRGAILAKGWMIGVQFEELFKDNLYIELGKESIRRMQPIKEAFEEAGDPAAV